MTHRKEFYKCGLHIKLQCRCIGPHLVFISDTPCPKCEEIETRFQVELQDAA